jgi:hypothetical protein
MVCRQIYSARSIGSTVALTSETRKRSSNAAKSSVVAILAIGMAAHTYGDVGYADVRSSQWHRWHDVCYLACRSWSNGLLPPKFFKQATADNAELLALSRPRNCYPGSAMAIMMRWRVPPPRKFAPRGIRVTQLDERLDETLACRPDILIADEPTTALDVTIRAAGSLPRSALQMTRRRLGGFNRRCARTQRGGQMPAADDAANSPCRSNNEAGDLDRRAV